MSRRDVEELIKLLQDAAKDSHDRVTLHRSLFDDAVTNLGRLEQALDNRPSLIKKLNEKIIKLEGELEILRNATRVNELEKKVQRLEGELQRSYATKNFTLKNGLLEIEKAYRDFISGSPAVQCLWDEITLLLVEDKESLPQHILQRRNTTLRSQEPEAPPATDATLGSQAAAEVSEPNGAEVNTNPSYVQQQVDKFKDYTFTPGTHDLHDPNHPAHLSAIYGSHHNFPGATPSVSLGGVPDARAGEVVDDRPSGLDERLSRLREQYNDSLSIGGSATAPLAMEPHWGSVVPAPSPLRPMSLFSRGGDAKPVDASAVEACRDELNASLEHLRTLFAQCDWAPTPLPGAVPQQGQQSQRERQLPDASAFTSMADSLEVSVQRLREYFGQMQWAPGGGLPGVESKSDQPPGEPLVPDATYFDSQAETILASVQHLRRQFQEAAAAAATEAAAAAAAGGVGPTGNGGTAAGASSNSSGAGGGPTAVIIPDASYFNTQADAIAASVNELLRLYEQSAAAAVAAAGNGGDGSTRSTGPWGSAMTEAEAAVKGDNRPAVTPDARSGEALAEGYDASVQPLVDLFSSFIAHVEATCGSGGTRGPWLLKGNGPAGMEATGDSSGDAVKPQQEGVEGGPRLPGSAELIQMFGRYAQAWPVAAAAAAVLRTEPKAAAAAPAAVAGDVPFGGFAVASKVEGSAADARLPGNCEADGLTAAVLTSHPHAVRFRITVNATNATAGGSVTAHLSPTPSSANLIDGQQQLQQRLRQRPDGTTNAQADVNGEVTAAPTPTLAAPAANFSGPSPAAPAAPPLEVLLSSLESRHGRGLTSSPEAVAVWRDLLRLLGVDPNSRPLPRQQSPQLTPPGSSASGTSAPAASPRPKQTVSADGGGWQPMAPQNASGARAWTLSGSNAGPWTETAGDARLTEIGAASPNSSFRRSSTSASEGGGGTDNGNASARGERRMDSGRTATRAGTFEANTVGIRREESADHVRLTGEEGDGAWINRAASGRIAATGQRDDSASLGTPEAGGGAEEAEAGPFQRGADATAEGVEMVRTVAERASMGMGSARSTSGVESLEYTAGNAVAGDDVRRASSTDVSNDGAVGSGSSSSGQVAEAPTTGAMGPGSTYEGGARAAEALHRHGFAGPDGESTGNINAIVPATTIRGTDIVGSEGPGLVAGGVRFQITLSEIAPVEKPLNQVDLQQQEKHPLVQFRANVNNGVDLEKTAATEAEVAQLRQVHHSLTEQLSTSEEVVRLLNRQLKLTMESRDDLAARAESLAMELCAVRNDVTEARHESDMFMRELVDAKVQLAEVQGEYMQVYQALKKALGNEKDMLAKIDELERILAVVGPGDVSVDDDYGSTVGQVSTTVTPREDYIGGGTAVGEEQVHHHRMGSATSLHANVGGGHGPEYGRFSSEGGKLERHASERRSVGDGHRSVVAMREPSSGGRSSSGGNGSGASSR